jgi:hypothetical protein
VIHKVYIVYLPIAGYVLGVDWFELVSDTIERRAGRNMGKCVQVP